MSLLSLHFWKMSQRFLSKVFIRSAELLELLLKAFDHEKESILLQLGQIILHSLDPKLHISQFHIGSGFATLGNFSLSLRTFF